MSRRLAATLCLMLTAFLAPPLSAQASAPAATWDETYAQLGRMVPSTGTGASVNDFVLMREAGQFTFASGTLVLLSPVGGSVVGASFHGTGTFTFAPRTAMERGQLARMHKDSVLTVPFSEAVFFFTDSTLQELQGRLDLQPGVAPGISGSRVSQALDYLGDNHGHDIDPDVLIDLLNTRPGGLFYSHIVPVSGSPIMFIVTPRATEGVELRERESSGILSGYTVPTVREAPAGTAGTPSGDRKGDALVQHYALDVSLPSTGSGDIGFSASARMTITGSEPIGPWVAFSLFEKFSVDSARWEDGSPAVAVKQKDSQHVWIRLPGVLQPGEIAQVTLYYHGDLIDREGDFFVIKGATDWYPRSLDGRSYATFEIVYHTPSNYLFASVGALADSGTTDRVTTSRWVTPRPIRNASFNVGMFKAYHPVEPGAPPVTVLVSESGHRSVGSKAYSADEASRDVARSMKMFTTMFGPLTTDDFYATEIPLAHGEAFAGLIDLSALTFDMTSTNGYNEVFRAHEVAHQWWGVGVDFATYRDQWLSEGFSEFAGLWYLQTTRGDVKQYLALLDQWKADILARGDQAAPIGMGYRAATADYPDDYSLIVYEKGAWVLHMLRVLMLDLKSMNEDRFDGMMRDFYATYRGKRASTADLQRMVERHTGQDMGWFFDQWVYGSDLPTYRASYKVSSAPDGKYVLTLRVRQQGVPDNFLAYMPVAIELGKDQVVRIRMKVTGPVSELELPLLPAKPKSVKFNDLDGVLADVKSVGWEG